MKVALVRGQGQEAISQSQDVGQGQEAINQGLEASQSQEAGQGQEAKPGLQVSPKAEVEAAQKVIKLEAGMQSGRNHGLVRDRSAIIVSGVVPKSHCHGPAVAKEAAEKLLLQLFAKQGGMHR